MKIRRINDSFPAMPYEWRISQRGFIWRAWRLLAQSGFKPQLRLKDGEKFITDNGNYIVDVKADSLADIKDVKAKLDVLPAFWKRGFFLVCVPASLSVRTAAHLFTLMNQYRSCRWIYAF